MAAQVATEADYDAVVRTIAAAFFDDPLWAWMFPDAAKRTGQQATMFGFYVESSLPGGSVLMADEAASAAIVYTPPAEKELTKEIEARIEPFLAETLGPTRRPPSRRWSASSPPRPMDHPSIT